MAVALAANASLIYLAISDPSFAVEPDYYRKALEWDRTQVQQGANERLGWSLDLALGPARTPGFVELTAGVRDRDGAPEDGARLTGEVFHNARAAEILPVSFGPRVGGGYTAELPLRRAGLWEFRLRAERGDEVFTAVVTRELGRGDRAPRRGARREPTGQPALRRHVRFLIELGNSTYCENGY